VQEALRFILARSVTWRALQICDGNRLQLRLAPAASPASAARLYPPLSRSAFVGYVNDSWELFYLYLNYVLNSTPAGYWNYVSYQINNACEASASSYDAWAYGICIVIEGIAHLIDTSVTVKDRDKIVRLRRMIRKEVDARKTFRIFAKRIDGVTASMLQVRPEDTLYSVVHSGHIDERHLKVWRKLRGSVVHPKKSDLTKLTPKNYQELFNSIHVINVLMYHVVFCLIGYKGHFTDYTTIGFPIRDYPLLRETQT